MGTKEDPFLIQSAADFEHLRIGSFGRKYFRMMTSVDLNNLSFSISSFNGVLDGNHCSVRGINISSTENTGLFGIMESDNVMSNLSLYDKISGTVCTGALAAITKGVVSGVVNYATVFGAGNLGGIIGNSSDTSNVNNCVNFGGVLSSSWNNGNIVGFAQNSLTNCVNFGTVTTSGDCAGGIAGTSHGFISHCINYGTVKAPGRAGGIVGK